MHWQQLHTKASGAFPSLPTCSLPGVRASSGCTKKAHEARLLELVCVCGEMLIRGEGARLLVCCLCVIARGVAEASSACVKQCYLRSVADSTLCTDASTAAVAAKLNARPCAESSSRWSFADGRLQLEGTDPALCAVNSTAMEGSATANDAVAVALQRCDALPAASGLSGERSH